RASKISRADWQSALQIMAHPDTDNTHPLLQHLSPLLATRARKRMAVVASTSVLFGLFSSGVEAVMPLWATQDLGLSPAQWAQMRSLRFAGVFIGVILLGALSDRFGQRLLGAITMLAAALGLFAFQLGVPGVVWWVMPVYGALISTAFVNLNTLTQMISYRRQGLANSIYRSIMAGATIIAPAAATWVGANWGGYPRLFSICAALLVASAIILLRYPGEETPASLGNVRAELKRLGSGYVTAIRHRPLMLFINLSMIWGNVLAGVGAFFAIYYTREFSQTDEAYGALASVAGALSLLAMIAAGLVLDRLSLRKLHGVLGMITGACSLVMGISGQLPIAAACFILFTVFANVLVGPSSMWVSRAAGEGTQASAFSVHKVLAALYVAVTMLLLGWLEHLIGMRQIFLYGGILGMISAVAFFLLPEPPLLKARPVKMKETEEAAG
ncbi:MAG: MFS transporter, partial [Armatimonadota bacterium]